MDHQYPSAVCLMNIFYRCIPLGLSKKISYQRLTQINTDTNKRFTNYINILYVHRIR